MKLRIAIPLVAVAIALAGCQKQAEPAFVVDDSHELHAAMIQNYWAEQTELGSQRNASILPYHFKNNSDVLNGLGEYEVDSLVRGAQGRPVHVYLARGDATDELYGARTNALIDALVAAGANAGSIRVHEKLAGGDGMDSDRVLFNADREAQQLVPVYGAPNTDGGSGSSM